MKLLALISCLLGADYTVVADRGPAGKYCAFPGACRMPDGRLICVYYNGVGHVTRTDQREGGGAIAYTISEDDGRTWSEPEMLLDTPMDDRDPSISLLRDGRLMLTYFRLITVPKLAGDGVYIAEIVGGNDTAVVQEPQYRRKPRPTEPKPGVLVKYQPAHVRKLQHDAGCSSPIRDFGNGLLMLGTYHLEQPYVLWSGDNGKVWQVFDIPNGGKHLDAETDVIEIENFGPGVGENSLCRGRTPEGPWSAGRGETGFPPHLARTFYAVMRGHKCNGHYSTSSDGKNWTVAEDIGFPLHCPELHRVELGGVRHERQDASQNVAPNSAILLAHRVPRTAMHYSLDECKTWVGPIKVDSCGGAYPCFVTCKDGSVLVIYYTEGTNSDIRCRRFSLTSKGIQWK